MVLLFLLPNRVPEKTFDLGIGSAVAQEGLQIGFFETEKTRAKFPVGGQPQAIALAAEGFSHRCDDSELAPPLRQPPAPGRFRSLGGSDWLERKVTLHPGEDFLPADHEFFLPGARGIERHEFDETEA